MTESSILPNKTDLLSKDTPAVQPIYVTFEYIGHLPRTSVSKITVKLEVLLLSNHLSCLFYAAESFLRS